MIFPKKRLILAGCLLMMVLVGSGMGDGLIYLRGHTKQLIETYAKRQGVALTIGSARWYGWRAIQLSDVQIGKEGGAARVGQVLIHWGWRSLLFDRRVKDLLIDNPRVSTGEMEELLHGLDRESPEGTKFVNRPYVVDHVEVSHGVLSLDNLGPGIPTISVQLGEGKPIEFMHLPLGPGSNLQPNLLQKATAENISITSPYDPLVTVLNFQTVNMYFTWAGLANNQIERLEIKVPTVYLGPDLFWFADQVRAKTSEDEKAHLVVDLPVWTVHNLSLSAGRLFISAFGEHGVELPFLFGSTATDVRLDRIQDLSIKNEIKILPEPIEYPDYNIALETKSGTINFDIPPNQGGANNLVPTIEFSRVSWRGIEATNAWASFTFDEHGISGDVGGEAYEGYLNGKFQIKFDAGYPWQAWGYVTNVNTQPVVSKLTEGRFRLQLSGRASGQVAIQARSTSIQETTADLQLKPPGEFHLLELDRVAAALPTEWTGIKRDLMLAALASFEDYPYTQAQVTAHYHFPESTARLELWGNQGHRVIHLNWTQDPSQPPLLDLALDAD